MDGDELKKLADKVCLLKMVRKLSTREIFDALSPQELASAIILYRVYVSVSCAKVSVNLKLFNYS